MSVVIGSVSKSSCGARIGVEQGPPAALDVLGDQLARAGLEQQLGVRDRRELRR
jgi:hypothetical protein